MQPRRLHKFVVVWLLLWAAVDLSVPLVCQAEDFVLLQSQAATFPSSSSDSERERDSRYDYEDDCFCCCAHIVPRPHFKICADSEMVSIQIILTVDHPDGITPLTYHPPRS